MTIVDSPSFEALAAGLGIAKCRQTDPGCGDSEGDGCDIPILAATLFGGEGYIN